jgi:hypothetical protein
VKREIVKTSKNAGAWPCWALVLVAIAAYFGTPRFTGAIVPALNHFPRYAEAFLHGQLGISPIDNPRLPISELIPSADMSLFYCPYPPLPAILLMPFVAVFGGGVTSAIACRVMSVINVLLFDMCLARIPAKLGQPTFTNANRFLIGAFFALGTVTWHNAHAGGDWHLAHAVTLSAELLALHEFLGKNRPLWIGGFLAMVFMTRPTAVLSCLFVLFPLLRRPSAGAIARCATLPVAAIVLLGSYNAARFGNPFDFGYSRMWLTGAGKQLMETYGQFHPHFVPRNFFWFFLAPPWTRPDAAIPLGFDPNGLSLFLASPALLFCFVSLRKERRTVLVRDALLSIALCLIPLLMYFNSGYVQFGHRFSMDYLAPLMLITIIGMGTQPSIGAIGLMILSIAIQAGGNLGLAYTQLPAWLRP